MAQKGAERETLSCTICLDLLKEPVTIPCGHTYCRKCICKHWDGENYSYSCPQCRKQFTPRPDLVKNTILARLVEDLSSRHDAAPSTAAEDVPCDFCTEGKRKASKTCLDCMASYCEEHLQPHLEHIPLRRHKLVDASMKLRESCSRAVVQKNIQDREKDVELLKQQVKTINVSANQAVKENEHMFTQLIRLLQQRSSELEKKVRSKQQTELNLVQELQNKLELEISELKKRDAELQKISTTEDEIQFVLSYSSLSALSVSTHSSIILRPPGNYFEEVTAAVSELRKHLHKVLMEDWTTVCHTVERVEVIPAPMTRAELLSYSKEIILDPNTASRWLKLSEENRKVTRMEECQPHPDHPERFTGWLQVLSRERLTGRSYWEMELRGEAVDVAVAYKSISRAGSGNECRFGFNDKSWKLICHSDFYMFYHNSIRTLVSGPQSSRIGVYVDHTAGILSFYSVSETMTLLHTVNTTFTEPLHAGVHIYYDGDGVQFDKPYY